MKTEIILSKSTMEDAVSFGMDYTKNYFKQNPSSTTDPSECLNIAYECYLQNKVALNGLCSIMECPVKYAKETWGKANKVQIKKAIDNLRVKCSECPKLSVCDGKYFFVQNTCMFVQHFVRQESTNGISIIYFANHLQTLSISEEFFKNCLNYLYADISDNKEYCHKLWNVAKDLPKGLMCKYCCNFKTDCRNTIG